MFEWYGSTDATVPKVYKVKQTLYNKQIADLKEHINKELAKPEISVHLQPGLKVAVAVGSRGISRIDEIVVNLIEALKARNMETFIVPAMGSHGGATAEGQTDLLASYNITSGTMGVPVKSSMEVIALGELEPGLPVYFDRMAYEEADLVIPVARVKPHPSFRGTVESGLCKMLVIGLGKHKGAQMFHEKGIENFHDLIPRAAQFIVGRNSTLKFGLAIVENAAHQPCRLEAVPFANIMEREPELLNLSRDLMARLLFKELDVLVIREIGKDMAGTGMDPNVTGRYGVPHITDGPLICDKIAVLDLTEETHGNANGLGLADITTLNLVNKIDFHSTYTNSITSKWLKPVNIPVVMPNDYLAIALAIQTSNHPDSPQNRLCIIRNTLDLEYFYISEALFPEIENHQGMEIISDLTEVAFDLNGNLVL